MAKTFGSFREKLGTFGREWISAIGRGFVSAKSALGSLLESGIEISPWKGRREVEEFERVTALPGKITDVSYEEVIPYGLHQAVGAEEPMAGPLEYTVHIYGRHAATGRFYAGDFPVVFAQPPERGMIEEAALARFAPEGAYAKFSQVLSYRVSEAFAMEGYEPW